MAEGGCARSGQSGADDLKGATRLGLRDGLTHVDRYVLGVAQLVCRAMAAYMAEGLARVAGQHEEFNSLLCRTTAALDAILARSVTSVAEKKCADVVSWPGKG